MATPNKWECYNNVYKQATPFITQYEIRRISPNLAVGDFGTDTVEIELTTNGLEMLFSHINLINAYNAKKDNPAVQKAWEQFCIILNLTEGE